MTDQANATNKAKAFLEARPSGGYEDVFYTLTFSPGVVRYLKIADFLNASVEEWIQSIRASSDDPQIKAPVEYRISDFDDYLSPALKFQSIDALVPNASWEDRLRAHHILGTLYKQHQVPSPVYNCFHSNLGLQEFELDNFLASWTKEAWQNRDVTESFNASSTHVIFECEGKYNVERSVFFKTPFVLGRLAKITNQRNAEEETRRAAKDLELLRKSNFRTFVYIMEDLRNGYFKIGHSKTPGKRERTLQSEIPTVTLRFSIPGEEEHEKHLHSQFAHRNQRGEWFSLTAEELLAVISYLKLNGDTTRASVDYEWLGRLYFQAAVRTREGHED